jgi:hypothetical protein
VGHAPAQRLGSDVHELNLLGPTDDRVGNRLLLRDARDLLHHVVDRLEVLDVDRGDDVDASVQQCFDVLPALLVSRPGSVGVGEFIDQGNLGLACEDRVKIHLFESGSSVVVGHARNDFKIAHLSVRLRSTVRLDVTNHHVRTAVATSPPFVEHPVGLADPGRGSQVDAELAAHYVPSLAIARPAATTVASRAATARRS